MAATALTSATSPDSDPSASTAEVVSEGSEAPASPSGSSSPLVVDAVAPVAEVVASPGEVEVPGSQPTQSDGEEDDRRSTNPGREDDRRSTNPGREDDRRSTNPGRHDPARSGDSSEGEAEWKTGQNLAVVPSTTQQLLEYDDDTTAPRGIEQRIAEANVLRARPRKTLPPLLVEDPPAERPRPARPYAPIMIAPDNRPAPISLLDAPLFDDSAFVRPRAPAARSTPRPKRRKHKGWLAWLFAGLIVLLLALGWSTLRPDASAAQGRTRTVERHATRADQSRVSARAEASH